MTIVVKNNANILQLAVFFITANLAQGVKVMHKNTEVENVHQFVSETASIIKHCVKRNHFLYTDVHQSLVQDLIISSLHSSALPVTVFNKRPHYDPSMPQEATAFTFLSDKGKVDLYMEYLAHISELPMWKSHSHVTFVDINFSGNHSDIHIELLKNSWQKYETVKSLVISQTEHSAKSGKFATAKIFNHFIAPGIMINLTGHNNTCKKSTPNTMGYPFKCPPTDFPPFLFETTNKNDEKVPGGMVGTIMEAACITTKCFVTTDLNYLKGTAISKWVLPNNFYETYDIVFPYAVLQGGNIKNAIYPFSIQKLVLIVPKALQMPRWMTAFLPFRYELWVLYLCCYPVLVTLGKIYSHFSGKNSQIVCSSLQIFRLFFLGMLTHQVTSASLRLYLLSVMVFNIVVNNAYSGSFTSYLTVPQYYADINNIDDIENRDLFVGLPVRYGSNMEHDFSSLLSQMDRGDKISATILERLMFVDTVEDGLKTARNHRNLSLLYFLTGAKYEVSKADNVMNNQPLLHIMEQDIMSLYLVCVFRENFPYIDEISKYILYLQEAGIIEKTWKKGIEMEFRNTEKAYNEITPLNAEHLQSFFYVLIIGYLISSLYFLTELVYPHIQAII